MKRAVLISGRFWTTSKQKEVQRLLYRYGNAVRFYIKRLWSNPTTTKYQDFGDTRLAARLKSTALWQAQGIVNSTKASARALGVIPSCPEFNKTGATLDAKSLEVRLDKGTGEFDLFIEMRVLHNKWLTLPCKATRRLRYWLAKPGAKLIQGATVTLRGLILWVDVPDPLPSGDKELGIDIGVNKVLTTSDAEIIGREYRALGNKVRRKRPGSRAKLRARRERDQFFRRCVNQLPWTKLKRLAIEDLTGMKVGKKPGRGKNFRKALAPWSYRQVVTQIELKAQENGVNLVYIDPRGTSRECPNCGTAHRLNRRDEDFLCLSCGHAGDADCIAAGNILTRARTMPVWSRHGFTVGASRKVDGATGLFIG